MKHCEAVRPYEHGGGGGVQPVSGAADIRQENTRPPQKDTKTLSGKIAAWQAAARRERAER